MPVISNRPRASRSSHFEITCVITPWIVLHSGQLQLLSSPLWRTDIQTILLSSTLLTNPGLHWTFLEVARRNFSNFLGFIILQVMVCSKEQSSLIPQYKRHRHRSQLSHQSPDLRLRRAARVSKQETIRKGYRMETHRQRVFMGTGGYGNEHFKGKIAEMKVYDVALNKAQIQTSIRQGSWSYRHVRFPKLSPYALWWFPFWNCLYWWTLKEVADNNSWSSFAKQRLVRW